MLTWFGECIEYNTARKQVWGRMMQTLMPVVTDGFSLNLCNVLLRLCEPFVKSVNDPKLLKVDPTYCAIVSNVTDYSFICCKMSVITEYNACRNQKLIFSQRKFIFAICIRKHVCYLWKKMKNV